MRGLRWWTLVAGLGAAVSVAVAPGSGDRAAVASAGLSAVFVLLAVLGVPRARRAPWLGILAMTGLSVGGQIWGLLEGSAWPSGADALTLGAYGALAWSVLALDRQRPGQGAFSGVLDALIVTTGAGVLALVFLIGPLVTDGTQSVPARVVGTLYPLMDVLLAYLVTRLLVGARRHAPAIWWTVAALVAALASDVGQNVVVLTTGQDVPPAWVTALSLLSYVLIGVAAVSARAGVDAGDEDGASGLTVIRLVVLGLAAGMPSIMLVVLAARGDPADGVYLGAGSLVLLVMVVARIWDLLRQLRRQSDEMSRMARTDPLTGVANRRSWDFELARATAAALAGGSHLLVGLLDLDHFKKYNDTHGHQAGDDLLREAARAWSLGVGPDGRIARWGGEEFAVVVLCADADAGLRVLDGLRALVPFGQTCSIGVARWDRSEDPSTLLRRADTALYEAKHAGRDRTVQADPVPSVSEGAP